MNINNIPTLWHKIKSNKITVYFLGLLFLIIIVYRLIKLEKFNIILQLISHLLWFIFIGHIKLFRILVVILNFLMRFLLLVEFFRPLLVSLFLWLFLVGFSFRANLGKNIFTQNFFNNSASLISSSNLYIKFWPSSTVPPIGNKPTNDKKCKKQSTTCWT